MSWGFSRSYASLRVPPFLLVFQSFWVPNFLNLNFGHQCLSTHWFNSLDDVRGKIEEWRNDYNGFRPHYSLSGLTPNEFLALQQNRPEALVSR
ncbi:hypothetical protein EKD00_00405 [Chlorobium phaeovibrioides]|nr:hypothetical protein EKD00_00405 [Chlorobium phaeovibrioides]